ncbi:hypothetical protein V1514DRAFT_347513 [Lipomyces japonicus]|uniref:uncharacterized protein n=1 Tax=Lipomyces japonicus TaxID=56871 RepID=UPI0034CFF422
MSRDTMTRSAIPPHTVRIKRKRNQDPLQALLLEQQGASAKRSKTNSYVFKFAATEETDQEDGAITLLEAPRLPETLRDAPSVLQAARHILNPSKLFRFPSRKRKDSWLTELSETAIATTTAAATAKAATATATPPPKRSGLVQPPILRQDDSVGNSQRRTGIPIVKVLNQPPTRATSASSVPLTPAASASIAASQPPLQERPIAIPHSTVRRRRSSTSSSIMSLSPSSSYMAANEDELQEMVDQYLQLNKTDQADKPSHALKRPHRLLHSDSQVINEDSETEVPSTKTPHVTGTISQPDAARRVSIDRISTVDAEIEDYVYDVYYREKYLGNAWDGGQYGLL